jgi:TetR/AcrR family transcriptional regulator
MDPVNIEHLFIMLWATTQFYADVDAMTRTGLDTRALSAGHFEQAEQTIIRIVLRGCGIDLPATAAAKIKSRARR